MRIAVSGSHRVGKTSLVEALTEALKGYGCVPEPYELLSEDGHEFAETPSLEDFELQLERSLEALRDSETNVLFDRCPLDILGYLTTHEDAGAFDRDAWMPRVTELVGRLDLIVFVPIEEPDRVPVPRSERRWRAEVDAVLREVLEDDAYGLEVDVLTVEGPTAARVQQVLAHVQRRAS